MYDASLNIRLVACLLYCLVALFPAATNGVEPDMSNDLNVVSCSSNSKVSSWCDALMNDVECLMDLEEDTYMCQCPKDPSACPDDCIIRGQGMRTMPVKTSHSVLCEGIPDDEPNYILKNDIALPLHHCENNGIVANWCSEATNPGVDCRLLPALDEYVCACREKTVYCPTECIEGSTLGRRTKHMVRCRGIPVDSPNYVLE